MVIKKEDKLRVYWSKKESDLMIYHPMGRNTSADGWYLNKFFNSEFIEEMKRRGYDLSSVKFEISPDLTNERFDIIAKKYSEKENE